MKRVFVSYSRSNVDVVTQLIQDMRAVGIDVWHDNSLAGGQRWWDNILARIRECDIFIFALSSASRESEACRSELAYVLPLNKTVLPVLVGDGISTNLLPAPFNDIQAIDYRRHDKNAAFALVKSINMAAPAPPLPDSLPPPPPVPTSYLGTLLERIESPDPLTAQDQITLLFELDGAVQDRRPTAEIRDLLLRLRRRDDLLARIASRIDTALKTLDDQGPGPLRESTMAGDHSAMPAVVEREDSNARTASGLVVCPTCHASIDGHARFCSACGAALPQQILAAAPSLLPPLSLTSQRPTMPTRKGRRYTCSPAEAARVVADLKNSLDAQKFDVQQMATENEATLLQIKKRGAWRDFVGMSTSLNIVLGTSDNTLTVDVGAGKWIDKAAVGAVSMVVLWPLAVTAGVGAWEQMKMPDRILDYIGNRLPS